MSSNVLVIHCAEGGRKALDKMAALGHSLPDDVRVLELPCSGRVNEVLLMESLEAALGGILVVGCRRENCKYLDGNLRAEKRVARVQALLKEASIRREVAMLTVGPDEGTRLHKAIEELRARLGRETKTNEA